MAIWVGTDTVVEEARVELSVFRNAVQCGWVERRPVRITKRTQGKEKQRRRKRTMRGAEEEEEKHGEEKEDEE